MWWIIKFSRYKIIQYEKPNYFLIVYDSLDSTLVSKDIFDSDEKEKIFELYRYKSKVLDESQFEIIFFVEYTFNFH